MKIDSHILFDYKDEIIDMYNQNMSLKDIASNFGVVHGTIQNLLKKLKIPKRESILKFKKCPTCGGKLKKTM